MSLHTCKNSKYTLWIMLIASLRWCCCLMKTSCPPFFHSALSREKDSKKDNLKNQFVSFLYLASYWAEMHTYTLTKHYSVLATGKKSNIYSALSYATSLKDLKTQFSSPLSTGFKRKFGVLNSLSDKHSRQQHRPTGKETLQGQKRQEHWTQQLLQKHWH